MKKRVIMIFIILVILTIGTTMVFATDPTIAIPGEQTANPGDTIKSNVTVSSTDTKVGVVSGKITFNSNIESITCTGKNNWSIQYNSDTGVFNATKAAGANNEEIMTIEYKIKDSVLTGAQATINVSDIKLTLINYETINQSGLTKTVSIVQNDNNIIVNEPESQVETENNAIENKLTENKLIENKLTENNQTTDNNVSTAKTAIPKTGLSLYSIPIIIAIILSAFGIIKYNKYKNI